MTIFYDILIIALCIGALWYGALLVVNSASRIAMKLGMSELVIGLTVVAFGTSAPEFAVTISAARLLLIITSFFTGFNDRTV